MASRMLNDALHDLRAAREALASLPGRYTLWTELRQDLKDRERTKVLDEIRTKDREKKNDQWGVLLKQIAKSMKHVPKSMKHIDPDSSLARTDSMDSQESSLTRSRHAVVSWVVDTAAGLKENVTDRSWFRQILTFVILLASAVVGLQTYTWGKTFTAVLNTIDVIVLYLFVLEAVLKIVAEIPKPLQYFRDGWNVFDFLIVTVGFMPIGKRQVALLRLIRLLRVLKVIRTMPALQVLVMSLIKSLTSLGYVCMLLSLVFYLYGCMGAFMFRSNDPANFENLHRAMQTLFRAATGDDWTDILYINLYGCDKYGYDPVTRLSLDGVLAECTNPEASPFSIIIFMVSFVFLTTFLVINVVVGVIVASTEEAQEELDDGVTLHVEVLACRNLMAADIIGTSDPYVVLTLGDQRYRTKVKKNTLNPMWATATFKFSPLEKLGTELFVQVYDWDRLKFDDEIGHTTVDVEHIPCENTFVEISRRLKGVDHGEVVLRIQKEVPVTQLDMMTLAPEDRLKLSITKVQELWEDIEMDLLDMSKTRQAVGKEVEAAVANLAVGGASRRLANTKAKLANTVKRQALLVQAVGAISGKPVFGTNSVTLKDVETASKNQATVLQAELGRLTHNMAHRIRLALQERKGALRVAVQGVMETVVPDAPPKSLAVRTLNTWTSKPKKSGGKGTLPKGGGRRRSMEVEEK